ncbi:Lcl domain-containing protein [Shewanella woodyi]|uniref:Lcl domain-containing protein n=1 Tax=Shewanella woodyi TaxID=60961 RepID=UPI0007F95EBB|nr:DUF1566 domain-containing protein [Shewanella woodyi]
MFRAQTRHLLKPMINKILNFFNIKKFSKMHDKETNDLAWFDESTQLTWELKNEDNVGHMFFHSKGTTIELSESHIEKHQIKFHPLYRDAGSYVDHLNKINYGGHSDWRAPTSSELQSLYRKETGSVSTPISQNCKVAYISVKRDYENMVIFDYAKGTSLAYSKDFVLWFRSVRGETPDALKTSHSIPNKALYANIADKISGILGTKENAIMFLYGSTSSTPESKICLEKARKEFGMLAVSFSAFPGSEWYEVFRSSTYKELYLQWGLWRDGL